MLGGITWWRYSPRLDLTRRILYILVELLGVISVCSHQHAMFKQIMLLCLPVGRFASCLGQILLPLTAARPNLCQRYMLMSEGIRIRPAQQVFVTQQTWSHAICMYSYLQTYLHVQIFANKDILIRGVTVRGAGLCCVRR